MLVALIGQSRLSHRIAVPVRSNVVRHCTRSSSAKPIYGGGAISYHFITVSQSSKLRHGSMILCISPLIHAQLALAVSLTANIFTHLFQAQFFVVLATTSIS